MAALCDIASWSLLVKLTQPWRTEKLFPELCQAGHLECQWVWWLFFFPPTSTQRNWSKLKCVYVLCGSHLNSSFLHQLFRWSPKNRQRWWRTKKAAASARKRDIGFVQEAAAVALFPYLVAPHCCHSCCCCCCYTCRQSFLCSLGNRACSRVAWFRARRVVCGETDESY